MKLKIKSIILYPENKDKKPRFINFKEDKVNVISGYSQRGKSAIISIVDYCLASSDCNIPIGLIRNKVDKFAIYISIKDRNLFIARDSPQNKSVSDIMYFYELSGVNDNKIFNTNKWIDNAEEYKTTRDYIKQYLNSVAGFENISESVNNEGKEDPASFRDTMAFTFQPQNIIANPTTIFYKTDTFEHQRKLKSIFPLVLGYKSFEIILLEREIAILEKEYQDLQKKYENVELQYKSWTTDIYKYYSFAIQLGLTDSQIDIKEASINDLKKELLSIIKQVKRKKYTKDGSGVRYADQLDQLDKERQNLFKELKSLKIELFKYEQVDRTKNTYEENVLSDIDNRLSPISWFLDKEGTNICPFCKSQTDFGVNRLLQLRTEQDRIRPILKEFNHSVFSFEKEKSETKKKIKEKEGHLQDIEQNINILLDENIKENNRISDIFEFIGKIENILENLSKLEPSSELLKSIREKKKELEYKKGEQKQLQQDFDKDVCLTKLTNCIGNYIKILPIEDKLRKKVILDPDKSINIRIEDSTTYYNTFLSKIGSGANHMCYHLATLLGLHEYFYQLEKHHKRNFVPSFLILDQPSQVYFPEGFPDEKNSAKKTEQKTSKDLTDTRSIFLACSEFMRRTQSNIQIIILEHASPKIWEKVPHIHLAKEWRGDEKSEKYDALIPLNWVEE